MTGATERDPRVDPRPGDVLAIRSADPLTPVEKRWVDAISEGGSGLRWTELLRETTKSYVTSIERWRKWAAGSEVIHRAEVSE